MVYSYQVVPGMFIQLEGTIFRIEEVHKNSHKAEAFIKLVLFDLHHETTQEQEWDSHTEFQEVRPEQRHLEFLYQEKEGYLFLDVDFLEQFLIPKTIVGHKSLFLKEGVDVIAFLYQGSIIGIELPQFLELMVDHIQEGSDDEHFSAHATKKAILETGASVHVPPFIESGDIIKIDTKSQEYIQRV